METKPEVERFNVRQKMALLGMFLGSFLIILDTNALNIALPTISQNLHVDFSVMEWILNSYTLTFSALLLFSARFGNKIGLRNIFMLGTLLFTVASLFCGLSSTYLSLIFWRICQGVGASLLAPAALSLISVTCDTDRKRTKALSLLSGTTGIAFSSSPIISGGLVAKLGWESVFFLNIPVGILVLVLTILFIPATNKQKRLTLLWTQQITMMVLLISFILCISEITNFWTKPYLVFSLLFIFAVALSLFLRQIKQEKESILSPLLFKAPSFNIGIYSGFVHNFSLYGMMYLFTIYFQKIQGISPLQTGFLFLPLTIAGMSTSMFVSAPVVLRFGIRKTQNIGFLVCIIGIFILALAILLFNGYIIGAAFILCGLGSGVLVPALTDSVLYNCEKSLTNDASSALNLTRQLGSALGIAVVSLFLSENHFIMRTCGALLFIAVLLYSGIFIIQCLYHKDKNIYSKRMGK